MFSKSIFAAFAALAPLSWASAVPADFVVARRNEELDSLVNDDDILNAFIEANHPSAVPNSTWADDNGEIYQTQWEFDEAEWQEMRSSLLLKAGVDESELQTRALAPRQDEDLPFFCKNFNTNPIAYTASLSSAAAGVCQGFVYGAQFVGRRQVVQRNLPDINSRPIRATITFVGKQLEWMVASGCATAMSIGINQACVKIEEGIQGEQPATAGFTVTDDPGVEASATLTFIG